MPTGEQEDTASGTPRPGLIDREACMGSGNCLYWAPEVFDLDDEGIAVVKGDPAAHDEQVRVAAANCPTGAIRVGRSARVDG